MIPTHAVTSTRMREIEAASEKLGVSTRTLMENAGRGIAHVVMREFPHPATTIILCGTGNNGGDGFVTARYLFQAGWNVKVLIAGEPEKLKGDARANFLEIQTLKVSIRIFSAATNLENLSAELKKADLLIDALFGTGLNRPVTEPVRSLIEALNRLERPVYSVDVPSGMDSDRGVIQGICVKALRTLTLGLPKTGLYQGAGPDYAGQIECVDIGLPPALLG